MRRGAFFLLLGAVVLAGCGGGRTPPPPIEPLEIVPTSLPDGARDRAYSFTVSVQGGKPPFTWQRTAGQFPAGITLDGTNGLLSGTPTLVESQMFTIAVRDSSSPQLVASRDFTLTIAEPLVVTTDTLPAATEVVFYTTALASTGGAGMVTWDALGTLPPALAIDTSGVITGLPLAAGSFPVSFRAQDQSIPPQQAIKQLSLTVVAGAPGVVARASVDSTGAEANEASERPAMSADGHAVAFESAATNLLGPGQDTNNSSDIFIHDFLEATTTRVSLTATGGEANGASRAAGVTGTLSAIAFESDATNLAGADTNGTTDIYVRLTGPGATGRVSLRSDGTQATTGPSRRPVLSDDARLVVFVSAASDLVAGDGNGLRDVFVRDRSAGSTTRISVGPGGVQATAPSDAPAISGDGSVILFESAASELASPATSGQHIFRHQAGRNTVASVALDLGNQTADIFAADRIGKMSLAMTLDEHVGRRVRIVEGTGAGQERLVASNTATTVLVAPNWDTTPDATSVFRIVSEANGASAAAAASADGKFIAFESLATNLIGAGYDTNGVRDIYVQELKTGINQRVSVALALANQKADITSANTIGLTTLTMTPNEHVGRLVEIVEGKGAGQVRRVVTNDATTLTVDADWTTPPDNTSVFRVAIEVTGPSFTPVLSGDGRFVAFQSFAADLVAGDTNARGDIFVHDRKTGVTVRVSLRADGTEANGDSRLPTLARDGRFCAFVSDATNLLATPDLNGVPDIFIAFTTVPRN